MAASVRPFGLPDLDLVLPLFVEMERHYEGDNAVDEATARQRIAEALSKSGDAIYLLASDDAPLGMILVSRLFPGPDLRSLWYLKDLFVSNDARDRGIGETLIRAAAKEVIARGGTRMAFTTGADNLGAQRLYRRLGANKRSDVVTLGFEEDVLRALAAN